MPEEYSYSPNFIAVVSNCGPFTSITAAVNYLSDFDLNSDQHGMVLLKPGVYDGTFSVSAADKTRYIDFVGSGIEETILTGNTDKYLTINHSGAENRFSNMTIEFTGSTNDTQPINVVDSSDVVFKNVRVVSTKGCIYEFHDNAKMYDSELQSTATSQENIVWTLSGLMSRCRIICTSIATDAALIAILEGVLEHSYLSSRGSANVVRCIGDIAGGRVSYCNIDSASYGIVEPKNGAIIEYTSLRSEGNSSTPVVDRLRECIFRHCNFVQDADCYVIGRVIDTGAVLFHCSLYAPNSSSNIVNSLEVDGSVWVKCSFVNSGGGGNALVGNQVGRAVTVGTITHNVINDVNLTITTMNTT